MSDEIKNEEIIDDGYVEREDYPMWDDETGSEGGGTDSEGGGGSGTDEELPIEDQKKAVNLQDLIYIKKYIMHKVSEELDAVLVDYYNKTEADGTFAAKEDVYTKNETDETFYKRTDTVDNAVSAIKASGINSETSTISFEKSPTSSTYKIKITDNVNPDNNIESEEFMIRYAIAAGSISDTVFRQPNPVSSVQDLKLSWFSKLSAEVWGDPEMKLPSLFPIWEGEIAFPAYNDYESNTLSMGEGWGTNAGLEYKHSIVIDNVDFKDYTSYDLVIKCRINPLSNQTHTIYLRNNRDKIIHDLYYHPAYDDDFNVIGRGLVSNYENLTVSPLLDTSGAEYTRMRIDHIFSRTLIAIDQASETIHNGDFIVGDLINHLTSTNPPVILGIYALNL